MNIMYGSIDMDIYVQWDGVAYFIKLSEGSGYGK